MLACALLAQELPIVGSREVPQQPSRSRRTPCEALYKSKKCMIDEGNGRYTPCEAMVKPKKAKKKG
jgi:hypothetical protein